jgi:hypothetical protein
MATGPRVKRLREMVDQIEQLPVSPDRDRLLSEVRSRVVDVDTGVRPRAILPLREPELAPVLPLREPELAPVLPLREPEPTPVLPRPPNRDGSTSITRMAPPPPAPAVEFARSASAASSRYKSLEQPPWPDGRLSLEDSPQPSPPEVRGRNGRPVPPWTLGLRG